MGERGGGRGGRRRRSLESTSRGNQRRDPTIRRTVCWLLAQTGTRNHHVSCFCVGWCWVGFKMRLRSESFLRTARKPGRNGGGLAADENGSLAREVTTSCPEWVSARVPQLGGPVCVAEMDAHLLRVHMLETQLARAIHGENRASPGEIADLYARLKALQAAHPMATPAFKLAASPLKPRPIGRTNVFPTPSPAPAPGNSGMPSTGGGTGRIGVPRFPLELPLHSSTSTLYELQNKVLQLTEDVFEGSKSAKRKSRKGKKGGTVRGRTRKAKAKARVGARTRKGRRRPLKKKGTKGRTKGRTKGKTKGKTKGGTKRKKTKKKTTTTVGDRRTKTKPWVR